MADNQEILERSLEVQTALNQVARIVHDADTFAEVMPAVESELLKVLGAERVTIYQKTRNSKEIISRFKTGTEIKEIRVPLTTATISGFVALGQKCLVIRDAYDSGELKAIHNDLAFGKSFDQKSGFRTRSVLAVPIKFQNVLLGVMQVLNRKDGASFSERDLKIAEEVGWILGQKFRYELSSTKSPYEHLVQTKRIKQEVLDEFIARSEKERKSVIEMLLTEGGISRAEMGSSLERFYQTPYQPYDPSIVIPRELLSGVKESYLLSSLWVPLQGDKEEVTVLIDDPTDASRIMEIQRILHAKRYVFKVGFADDIRRFLGQNAGPAAGENAAISDLVEKLAEEEAPDEQITSEAVDESAAVVIQLVNKMIIEAYDFRASDIHVEPGKGKASANVRIRVDGDCRTLFSIPATHIQAVVSRIKIMSGLDISERRKPQDGKCTLKFRGTTVELRIATLPTVNGESVVLRILSSSEPLPLDKLALSTRNLEKLVNLVTRPHGLFLVVGPTGSGKTTTLHGVLAYINKPDTKIWTAEDPVEITQPGLQQLQVQPKIGLDFAGALRAFLRADPDVIMIGEMRDQETAHAGVEASLTGHLVLSTLHTNSAPETVVRLLDLGLDPASFSDALLGVLAQRLVRTLCADCKTPKAVTQEECDILKRYYGEEHFAEVGIHVGQTKLYRAVGCKACGGTGYRGRVGIHELLFNNEAMRTLVYRRASAGEIRAVAIDAGMRTLMQDAISKLVAGLTDLEQIRNIAIS